MIMEEEVWEERPAFSDQKKEEKKLHHHKQKDKEKEKKHKHKHKNNHKKKDKDRGEKRKKHTNKNSDSGSGSEKSEEDDGDEDVKKPKPTTETENEKTNDDNATTTKAAMVQRESWMTSAPSDSNWLLGSKVSVEEKNPTVAQEENDKVAVGLTVRDNNENNNNNNATNDPKRSDSNSSSNKTPSWMVGDGGQSWRARALRRAREQASESGESVNSVVEGRFGSIEELEKRTQRGRYEERGPPHHHHHNNDRDRDRERERERDRHQERGQDRDRDGERGKGRETEKNGAHQRREGDYYRDRERSGRVFEDPSKRMMTPSISSTDLKWGSKKSSHSHSDPKTTTHPSSFSTTTSLTSSRSSPQPSDRFGDKREDKGETENVVQRDKERNENHSSSNNNIVGSKSEESETVSSSQGTDINKLVAQVLKAKLKGDKELVKKLEQEIEEAKRASNKVVVKIPMMDLSGRQMVGNDKADATLQTLLSKERYAGSKDYDYEYASALMKTKKGMLTDEDYDQIGEEKIPKQKKKEEKSKQKQQEKEKQQVISSFKRTEAQESNCWFCYTSNTFDKSLMVSTGNHVYLSLPSKGTLAPGHCMIVPIRHTVSVTSVDEDVFTEIQNFKKCLIQMMASLQKECIFLETVMNLKKQNHTFLECIPLSPELAENAPFYYKKALSESESEWAQHKKIIDTRGKGIKKCVPEGFPYFHVEFGYNGGFAHVIEDEIDFPRWFGKEVVGGMLELGPEYWRHPKSHTDQEKRVTKERFAKQWEPYNWTKALD